MTNTFNIKNFVRIFYNNTRSLEGKRIGHQWDTNKLKMITKKKNNNVQTYLMPMQQGRKGDKERKPLFGRVGGGGCLVVLL